MFFVIISTVISRRVNSQLFKIVNYPRIKFIVHMRFCVIINIAVIAHLLTLPSNPHKSPYKFLADGIRDKSCDCADTSLVDINFIGFFTNIQ